MKKPSKDFSDRLSVARRWRDSMRPLIEEVFKHCSPGRQKDFSSTLGSTDQFEVETFHSMPEELAMDLASDFVTYFTPREARWTSYAVISEVPKEFEKDVIEIVTDREDKLFNIISSSNYNDIAPQWGFETATHGTPALWVTQSNFSDKMHFEVVPPHELLIVPGYRTHLDRFREMTIGSQHLQALLSMPNVSVDLSDQKIQTKMKKPSDYFKVVFGFWVDWSDPGFPKWLMEITVDGLLVTNEKEVLGPLAGTCPLLVGRFNPQPRNPWGRGPGLKALPDMRTLDTLEDVMLTAMDENLKRTLIYPDDGFLDMTEGLEAGRAYPAARGFTRDQIYEVPGTVNLDYGFYNRQDFENRLRVAFYQDGPRQTGDTPPTATQWIDERRRVQLRIGKPSAPLWTELIVPMIQRVEYLSVANGALEEALSHADKDILIEPVSPLQKAQNADKVMITRSNIDIAAGMLGPNAMQVIDPISTLNNIADASGDELLVLREMEAGGDATPAAE